MTSVHHVGRLCLLQPPRRLLYCTVTASLPPTPSVAPEPTGFMNYGLPAPRSSGPCLPWNKKHGEVLKLMHESFKSNIKFYHLTSAERSGFASTGALLTPWSPQVATPLAQYYGVVSPVIANYVSQTESLACTAIEAHEHSIQLLEVLTKNFSSRGGRSWSNAVTLKPRLYSVPNEGHTV